MLYAYAQFRKCCWVIFYNWKKLETGIDNLLQKGDKEWAKEVLGL